MGRIAPVRLLLAALLTLCALLWRAWEATMAPPVLP